MEPDCSGGRGGQGGEYKKAKMKRCDERLVLKEGWPDHFLILIQMLIPAGVVDLLFKFRIFSFEGYA